MNSATKLLLAMRRSPLDWQRAQPGDFIRSRDDGEAHCEAGRASRAKPIAGPIGAKRGRGMTARRPPAPVEVGKPDRTDNLFAANPMSISAQLIFGAGLMKYPGQLQTVARQHGIEWRHNGSSHCVFLRADGRTLPVPAHRPIKPFYIRRFLELIDGE